LTSWSNKKNPTRPFARRTKNRAGQTSDEKRGEQKEGQTTSARRATHLRSATQQIAAMKLRPTAWDV